MLFWLFDEEAVVFGVAGCFFCLFFVFAGVGVVCFEEVVVSMVVVPSKLWSSFCVI